MIVELISQTLIIVILLTFSFGPSFFALINTGIKNGYRTGSILAAGIVISDFVVCLIIVLFVHSITTFIENEKNQRFMGILAGLILVVFGAFYFKRPVSESNETIEIQKPSVVSMLLKGFFLNSVNPSVWLLWLGNVTAISKTLNNSIVNMIAYFGITLGIVLFILFGMVSVAEKVKAFLTLKVMHTINLITGAMLIIFGLVLIYNHYF